MGMMNKAKAQAIQDGLEKFGAYCPIAIRGGRHMDATPRRWPLMRTTSLGFFTPRTTGATPTKASF